MDFLGREGLDEDADSQMKHYVAVVDPEHKTWQFVEARRVTLRGAVRTQKPIEEEEEEEEEEESDEEMVCFSLRCGKIEKPSTNIQVQNSIREQRTALISTFGTKQARKSAQSKAENAQLSNAPNGMVSEAGAALLSSLPSDVAAGTAKAQNVQAEVQAAKPLPPANVTASHPSGVYPLETLVPNGHSTLRQLTGVNEWQEQVEAGLSVNTMSRFVSNRIGPVVQSENLTHVQVLRFIQLLLEFNRSLKNAPRDPKGTVGPGSKRLPPREVLRRILSSTSSNNNNSSSSSEATTNQDDLLPESVFDAIRRRFAPNGAFLTKHDITLLHTTICALSLHIPPQPARDGGSSSLGGNAPNELATDPSDLRDDLRLDSNTVYHYFRELGCHVDRPRESEYAKWNVKGGKGEAQVRRVARLHVPVKFPKVSRGGRK